MRAKLKLLSNRAFSTGQSLPVLRIPNSNVYRYGDAPPAKPLFHDLEWTIQEDEAWSMIGGAGSGKNELIEVLLGHHRLAPPPSGGVFPFLQPLNPPRDTFAAISHVSFATRPKALGGGFYDYSARYGAVRDEDKITLRESMLAESASSGIGSTDSKTELERLAGTLELEKLLDLPLIALSNGQTRRASVLRKLLTHPELLILDEPLTGLDPHHRANLIGLLKGLHERRKPRILLALRPQDPLPNWISHVALVSDSHVKTGRKEELEEELERLRAPESSRKPIVATSRSKENQQARELVAMKDLNIGYHGREVLKSISWSVREGDRWHLQGANGSGKTTLLSVLTGDHPQSYVQRNLNLFGKPRRSQATLALQQNIGFVSPELYNAFPRRLGEGALSARDAIATGFECTFSYRPRTPKQEERVDELLGDLAPEHWLQDKAFTERAFASLQPGEQSLCLLLRALVNAPSLLILDEVFAGMDEAMVSKARRYLQERLEPKQAVVWVSHWEEELPWDPQDVRRLRLVEGRAAFS